RAVRQADRDTKGRQMLLLALPFPDIDPAIFSVELGGFSFSLRWYALAYIGGLLLGWRVVARLASRSELWPGGRPPIAARQAEDLLTWMIFSIILGGRLGFVLFYRPEFFFQNPVEIFRIWNGGMSFHGGFLGVVAGTLIWCRRNKVSVLGTGDALALAVPVGLFFGRIANFINGELWGRPSTVPWAVQFPGADCPETWTEICARHPSQLYEAGLEGVLLFAVLYWLIFRRGLLKVPGRAVAVFFIGYGGARVFVEGLRQADAQYITPDNPLGHVIRFGAGPEAAGLTMGQVLSLPMIIAGLVLWVWAARRAG
ncbi:MAG: prolipoprotein diacylglyceryl transferase, partial [Paracoccaceae bacterium]